MSGQSRGDGSSRHVLIVDDDPTFVLLAELYLKDAGYQVSTATDGAAALEMLDRFRFDLAIIDLLMPRIDGLRLIGLIRGAPWLKELAILVVSASRSAEEFNEALAMGANGVEAKPVEWTRLPDLVASLLPAASRAAG